jgi:hypothetical protein
MKKVLFALLAVVMLSSFAYATPIKLVDITYFTEQGTTAPEDYVDHNWGDVNKLDGSFDYVTWKHQYTFSPPAQELLNGTLTIWLEDDEADFGLNPFSYELGFGFAESGVWDLGEVNTGTYTYNLDLSFLEDGEFQVTIASLWGDFYILKSELEILYDPVPEPGTLLLLGSGILGLGYSIRKRMKKYQI